MIWNVDGRAIDLYWKSGDPEKVDRHFPTLSDALPTPPAGSQAILPAVNEFRRYSGDLVQIALIHLEEETLQVQIESVGHGRISFTRYPKDNTHMQTPDDPEDPFGNEFEVPSGFIQMVGGHLIEMSSTGHITAYYAVDTKEDTTVGESISYAAFNDFSHRTFDKHFPFMCTFSGIVGTVSSSGDFYIWAQK